jgi:hypothetical protein
VCEGLYGLLQEGGDGAPFCLGCLAATH